MNPEAQEYYNIAGWLKDKVNYNRISKFNTINAGRFCMGRSGTAIWDTISARKKISSVRCL